MKGFAIIAGAEEPHAVVFVAGALIKIDVGAIVQEVGNSRCNGVALGEKNFGTVAGKCYMPDNREIKWQSTKVAVIHADQFFKVSGGE